MISSATSGYPTEMPTDFHNAPKAWAQIKHSILGNYLSLFLGKLGRDRIFYVDGFAGPGRLKDGSDGSPLVAAHLAASPKQKSREGVLHCINVESVPKTFDNLQEATGDFVRLGLVENLPGSFAEQLAAILTKIGSATTFFFIDPFGTQGAEVSTIQSIVSRRGKSEVLVRYDDTRVKRLLMWACNNQESIDPGHQKTAQRFAERVSGLTDKEAADEVEEALASEDTPDRAGLRTALLDGYIRRVKALTGLRFSLSYPIRNPATGGHRYFLVHFCNHPDGYVHMANFMAKVERSQQESAGLAGIEPQLELMGINEHIAKEKRREAVREIVGALPSIFVERGWLKRRVANRDLFAAVVDEFRWQVTRSEAVAALRELEKEGYVAVESPDDGDFTVIH